MVIATVRKLVEVSGDKLCLPEISYSWLPVWILSTFSDLLPPFMETKMITNMWGR